MNQTSSTIVPYTVWGSKGSEGVGRGMETAWQQQPLRLQALPGKNFSQWFCCSNRTPTLSVLWRPPQSLQPASMASVSPISLIDYDRQGQSHCIYFMWWAISISATTDYGHTMAKSNQPKEYIQNMMFACFKVRIFWEAHKIWKNLPHSFDVY